MVVKACSNSLTELNRQFGNAIDIYLKHRYSVWYLIELFVNHVIKICFSFFRKQIFSLAYIYLILHIWVRDDVLRLWKRKIGFSNESGTLQGQY